MDITKQVKKMIAFMEKEGDERAQEIDAKADEEYNIYVGQMVQNERREINAHYKKEEEWVVRKIIVSQASALNASRIEMMRFKQEVLDDIYQHVNETVKRDISNKSFYHDVMKKLILQGTIKILAPKQILRTRHDDVALVKGLLDSVRSEHHKMTGVLVDLTVDHKHFLPVSAVGGVEIFTSKANMKTVNTLRYRVDLIRERMMPIVRFYLFGANPRRIWYN